MENRDQLAFPVSISYNDINPEVIISDGGLTKREYFAGLAMQGLCASGFFTEPELQKQAEGAGGTISDAIAISAVDIADSVMKELEKKQG